MLNLEDAIKNAVERICRDRNEDDKIYIHVSDLAGEAIRQHAKILHDMRRANEEAQELTKAKAEGRLIVLPCKAGDSIYRLNKSTGRVHEGKVDKIHILLDGDIEINMWAQWGAMYEFLSADEIGKTVFQTREAAEKALEGGSACPVR